MNVNDEHSLTFMNIIMNNSSIPSGKRLHSELERSTMLLMGSHTLFRLGHGFNSQLLVITRGYIPLISH